MEMWGIDKAKQALYVLYLPLNGNDGRPQPRERSEWALAEVARFAGGYTLLPAGDGAWVDGEGRVCYDRVLPVLVVAPAGPQGWAFFARLAAVLARILEQQEVFIHATPVAVVEALPMPEVGRDAISSYVAN